MNIKNFLAAILLSGCTSNLTWLEDGFRVPPENTKPGTYWYWMNEHVSKEGITKDLEAMKSVGIGEAFLGNIFEIRRFNGEIRTFNPEEDSFGEIRTLTPQWEDCMRFALTEGERIGIKVGSFNCPGWSMAGGPWVKPEDAMRYLTYSEAIIDGDVEKRHTVSLPRPTDFFQDVVALAVPIVVADVFSELSVFNDLKFERKDKNEPATFTFSFPHQVLKRSLVITPAPGDFIMDCEVYALHDVFFECVASAHFDRAIGIPSFGPVPLAPLCLSLGETTAQEFQVVMSGVPENFSIKKIEITAETRMEHYSEKLNNKLPLLKTPDWYAYQWKPHTEHSTDAVVARDDIMVVSEFLHGDTLRWQAPAGRWRLMRLGMALTKTTNNPTAPWTRGLEIDKMNRRALQEHYDAYIGKIVKGLPNNLNFHRVIADSYEVGPSSWTDDFDDVFRQTYGYDPLPWLALFSGQVVGSAEQSDRFMWDLRRLVADRIASEFVGGMAEVMQKNGSQLWLENYGWDGFPSEFLKYAKLSPAIGGEFWTDHPNVECRLAASACHIYGKNVVYAESYTTGDNHHFEFHPRTLKKKGDEAYTEGINQHIISLMIHQPYEDKVPGINSWFGFEHNRHNTWFEQSKAWIDYQRRCCFMLQQGKPAADVCFFIGEDCPKMAGWKDPALSTGYDYDFINADVIINDMTVKNGRLTLPSGVSYSLLALSPLTTMRPELLEKIEQLVKDGANIMGAPVNKSPSLQGYPLCDEQVRKISARLWNRQDSSYVNQYGQGKVFFNMPVNEVLATIGTPEAVRLDKELPVLWKQRDLPNNRKIYFLANQSDTLVDCNVSLRTAAGFVPEWWNPVNGELCPITEYRVENGYTRVHIRLDAAESGFVVFRSKNSKNIKNCKEKELLTLILPNNWDIDFHNRWTGEHYSVNNSPLFDWTQSPDNRIKYFSGTATCQTEFDIQLSTIKNSDNSDIQIVFENIGVVATVFVNGQEAGTLWTKPYRLNIGDFVKEGKNALEIRVTNTWRNKIVDKVNDIDPENKIFLSALPLRERYGTWLMPSGIWGDVKIVVSE